MKEYSTRISWASIVGPRTNALRLAGEPAFLHSLVHHVRNRTVNYLACAIFRALGSVIHHNIHQVIAALSRTLVFPVTQHETEFAVNQ